jgi:adenylate kinase
MADSKEGAYTTKAADTDFRRKWDKEEYAEKARKKDDEERERMQENEERMKQGTGTSTVQLHPQANHLGSTTVLTIINNRQKASQRKEERPSEAYRAHETA